MNSHDLTAAAARVDVARVLATCFGAPTEALAARRLSEALRSAGTRLDPDLGRSAARLADAFARESVHDLLLDHARLFLRRSQSRAMPYGSFWLDDDAPLMGDSTMAVLQHYEDGGFEVDEGFRDLPDHVAVELEYLYVLLFREAEAAARNDVETLRGVSALRCRFLAEHLGEWIAPFAAAVREGAECVFYCELADLTERFVAMEAARRQP